MDKLRAETIELIKQIYKKYPSGGALHIVLDDGNDDDGCILWCLQNSILDENYYNIAKQRIDEAIKGGANG